MSEVDTGAPMELKKYQTYKCKVDPDQDDKATEIKLCDFSRPHMRAFHWNWFSFFMAFCIWYAIVPLLSEIKKTLGITKQQIWTSSIVGVSSTIFIRFVLGPLNDKFGPRILFTGVLCCASIPCACIGFVNSAKGLSWLRFFIGIAGGSFVMCQYWTSRMFAREVVGTANAVAAGWGNLGAGAIQLIVGSLLFPLFKIFTNGNAEMAWRTVCIVPAVCAFACGIVIYFVTDDAPKGNYTELKKNGLMQPVSAAASFRSGALNLNTWIMFIHYGCCFGVELTMNNAAALYFKDKFGQSTESAAALASIFGWMNIFARGLGGYLSDKFNARMGMRGRILIHTYMLLAEGGLVLLFAHTNTLGGAIAVMIVFGIHCDAACGTSYGIVPYVDPASTGAVSGIVGAGGNCGAVGFGLAFRNRGWKQAFIIMGATVMGSTILSCFIFIKGCSSLLFGGEDTIGQKAVALEVPGPETFTKGKEADEDDNVEVDA